MKNILIINLLAIIFIFLACHKTPEQQFINSSTVIVSKIYKKSISNWLRNTDSNLNIIQVYGIKNFDSLQQILSKADGIIISGGEDVNPYFYHQKDTANLVETTNPYRDSLEIFMINYALQHKVPLLGICRGHQIINVALGGTLIMDIPTYLGTASMHRKNGKHTDHLIYIVKDLPFSNCHIPDSGLIYSSHHQAVGNLAKGLDVFAIAKDSIIEGFYYTDTTKMPFLLGVQWHPEAMNFDDSLSKIIAECFIFAVKKYSQSHVH